MAAYPDFDISIKADTIRAEAVKARAGVSAAVNLSFDEKWFPVEIRLKQATDAQVQKIADAINAIMDGRAVTIEPEA